MARAPLEEQILEALERAITEGRLDVADDLLKALETLCPTLCSAPLAEAYLSVAGRRKKPQ